MEKLVKSLPIIVALIVGGFLGYYFTNNYYTRKEASNTKTEYTAICRLELREGNKDEVKEKYIALLEYRNVDGGKEFCEEYIPTKYLPDNTKGMSLDSLYSEEDYKEQLEIAE